MSVSAQVTICIHSLHIVGTVCLHVGDVLSRGFRVCLFLRLCAGGVSYGCFLRKFGHLKVCRNP